MRDLKHAALFSALALSNVVSGLEDVPVVQVSTPDDVATVPNPQSLYIQFMHPSARGYGYGQDLGFRLDVNPSSSTPGSCASPNITINNQPLLEAKDGSFVLDNAIEVGLEWESRCFPSSDSSDVDNTGSNSHSTTDGGDIDTIPNQNGDGSGRARREDSTQRSQSVTLNLKIVDGQPVKEDLACTIWFRQEEPVWAFGVAGWCIDARIRDVRGKSGGWEPIFDDDYATSDSITLGEGGNKKESREMRLLRERKEFEKEVECLESRRSLVAQQDDANQMGGHGDGHVQKPFVSREYEENRQRLEALCANFVPRAIEASAPSVHPPWQLPRHRPARPARLAFPGLFLDEASSTITQQRTWAGMYTFISNSIHAHLTNLSPTRLSGYLILLSLPIFACVFSCLRRLCKRRRRLAQQNDHVSGGMPESPCPGFYGSDESCGECKARYLSQLKADSASDPEASVEEGAAEVTEKTTAGQNGEDGEEEVSNEKQPPPEPSDEITLQKEEIHRLSERQYEQYREYHTVPMDGFALRYEPGSGSDFDFDSETQTQRTIHGHIDQYVGVEDDTSTWDGKSTLVDSESEDEREKEDSSTPRGESSGGRSTSDASSLRAGDDDSDDDDDLSIGGELASFMMAANLVEDMIRAGASRREAIPGPPDAAPLPNVRRQSPSASPPPPSYREVVGLRSRETVGDDEGWPPRYEDFLRSQR
ncbi:hypothetical protein B0T20DRAFT_216034 [Sordaria brevicollis]|uniref:Uncharacterized protein n=1 Tax=Sordaria brevicollis TaxID=83679 RepID=A0AAE0UC64_SORBR|nr:hypothetical protein B0T20DRAFT_216034 [Sordaria brevicollis]